MCNSCLRIFFSALVLLLSTNTVQALPFSSFDPRSMAMGGTGVAVGDPSTAPFFNPAMLAASDTSKKFSFEFPIIGVRLIDPANMHSNLSNLSNDINSMNSNISSVQNLVTTLSGTTVTAANASTVQGQLTQLQQSLTTTATNVNQVNSLLSSLSNQPIQGELGAATVIGIPGKDWGFAVYAEAWGALGGTVEYKDGTTLGNLSGSVTTMANTVGTANAAITACAGVPLCLSGLSGTVSAAINGASVPSLTLKSQIHIRGVAIDETGLSISHGLVTNDHAWSFGITPKVMQLRLFDALLAANNGSSTSGLIANDYLANYSTLNFDAGIAETFLSGWRTGLVVKNAIPHTFDFKQALTKGGTPVADGSTLKMNPQLRTGVSYENKWSTVAFDLDLTRNNPAGLESQSQYAGIGGEVNTSDWVQLRAGYRYDMINPSQKEFSLGFGLSPRFPFFKTHLDFAVTASPDIFSTGWNNAVQAGASMKLGLNF